MRWRVLIFSLGLISLGVRAVAEETPASSEQDLEARLNAASDEDTVIQALEDIELKLPDSPTAAAKILNSQCAPTVDDWNFAVPSSRSPASRSGGCRAAGRSSGRS
jgi:hypothetical protein